MSDGWANALPCPPLATPMSVFTIHLLTEKKVLRSLSVVTMTKPPAALLVVSPSHGKAKYRWEYKSIYVDKWNLIEVPWYTCLLFVDTARKYRCTVEGQMVVFDVKGMQVTVCTTILSPIVQYL